MRKPIGLFILLITSAFLSYSQSKISGKITDNDNLPVPFATVSEANTKNGVTSDVDGNFSIDVATGAKLKISAIGYQSQTVDAAQASTINLIRTSSTLQEVVVTGLGIASRKDRLTSSQSTVKGAAIAQSGEVSVLNGIASKASGVFVSRSGGDPGAGTYIQIRGQSTITGNLQPLFIIDGVPVSNSTLGQGIDGVVQQSRMNDLNAEDVESMEVLKGAAAAALYGTRAANGVVLITTKKGRNSKKINISLTNTYSVDDLNKSVPLQRSYGQGSNGIYGYGSNGNNRSWGDKISERAGGEDVFNTDGAYAILPDGSKRYLVSSGTADEPHGGKRSQTTYDHAKDLFENGFFLDNTLALSGGDEKGVFYTSFSNLKQEGILKAGSDYDRKTFRLNADRKFGIAKIGGTFNYVHSSSDRAQQGSNISGIFLGGLRTAPDFNNAFFEGTYVDASGAEFPNRQISYRNPIGARTNSGYDNPNWVLNRIKNTSIVNRVTGSFEGTLTPLKWLSIVERAGIDNYNDKQLENFPGISSAFPGGQLTLQTITETQFNNDLFARANFDLNDKINLSVLAGWNFNHRSFDNIGGTVRNFINENILDPSFDFGNSPGDARFPFNSASQIRTTAGYAQVSVGLFDQLFVDLTGRSEAASTFNNTFFYPSASIGWQFSKLINAENATSKTLSFGKLRASYGEVGVQPDPYLLSTYYNPLVITESFGSSLDASSATYNGGGYSRSSIKGNPDLEPERKTEFELGTDLRFLDNRLSLSATYYKNKTKGAIFSVQVPSTTGYTNTNANAAELENKGVEFDFGYNWLKTGDLSITTNIVASQNKNKVVSLKGVESFFLAGFTGSSSRAVEGQPLGVLWSVDFLKDDKGNLVLDDNGFPQNAPSESVVGDPNPDWIGGITNTIRYKNFNLSFLIDHVQGGDVWNGTAGALYTFGTHAATGNEVTATKDLTTYYGDVIPSGTKFRGAVNNFGGGDVALTQQWYTDLGGGFGPVGSQFIEDGTRTRLREVSLGYSVKGAEFARKTRLQSIDFSVTGRNLALWTDYTGIDPETNITGPSNGRGLDYFNNPSTRSYLFTIRINY
ncbi:MAG: SusC/RagA family TonB-linked outer membrane protein [Ginsengibacter sp.]